MCRTDNYILRITSTSLAKGVTLSENNSKLSFETPDYLRKKGKCKITVVGGNICLVDGTNRLNTNSTKSIFCLISNIPQLGYFTENRGANTVLGTCPTIVTGTNANNDGYNVPFTNITPLIFTCPKLPPVIEVQRMLYSNGEFFSTTGDTTSGNPTIADIANVSDLQVGDFVSGAGIPANAYIIAIPDSNSITINANATATAQDVALTFSHSKLTTSTSTHSVPFYVELDIQFYEDMP